MQMFSKKMIIPMAAVAIIGAGAFGVAKVSAATDPNNPQASLVQKIADTFHLDKSKVQAVFDQNKADNQASREQNYEARLTQAVTDGKITAAQKGLILAEHAKLEAELKASMTSSTTANRADRRTEMEKIRTETTAWATANGIDAKWLMTPGGPGHMRGGMGGGMMGAGPGPDDGAAPSVSPSPTPGA